MSKELKRTRYSHAVEYIGGYNPSGKSYTFSDGVGCMSRAFAREISKELHLGDYIPSCIQSRFRGFKVSVSNKTFSKFDFRVFMH